MMHAFNKYSGGSLQRNHKRKSICATQDQFPCWAGTSFIPHSSTFLISHGKSAVKNELRNCIDCFKLVAKPVSQMMGDLPIEQINPCRAFEKEGIDFAGPITTKCHLTRQANKLKSCICLFICMCTKAVHLELVCSLSAAAFLSALRRFVSRSGYPSDIYSDNGSRVLIKNPASFSTRSTPGRIVVTHPGADGICRVVNIQTSSGVLTRPVSQVAVLPIPLSTISSRPPEDIKNS
ncbi:integrase catalytic domain-containing protein [Trichonephila clavipes]|nr:integrase catalytic domain-containing protein [Trichonephila clavipes]